MFGSLKLAAAGTALLSIPVLQVAQVPAPAEPPAKTEPARPFAPPAGNGSKIAIPGTGKSMADDEVIRTAEDVQKNLKKREEQLAKAFLELDALLKTMGPGNIPKERKALDDYVKIIQMLRQQATELIDKHSEFIKHYQLYRNTLEKTPEALNNAGQVYQKFADEEPSEFFKEQYLDNANKAKSIADVMAQRIKDLDNKDREVTEKIAFVQRSRVFLDRQEGFVRLVMAGGVEASKVEEYVQSLNKYIQQFEQNIRMFREITDKIQGRSSLSGTIQPK